MNTTYQTKSRTRKLVIIGMLSSISIFMGLTGLGFIPIPPVKATIMHIPVIIGAIIEGPVVGGLIGLVFGLFSMYQSVTSPTPTSFIFWNPIIALLPRILIGVFSYYIYNIMLKGVKKNLKLTSFAASFSLSMLMFFTVASITKSNIIALTIAVILFIISSIVMLNLKHPNKEEALSLGTASVLGTLINTLGVLGLTYIIYLDKYATALGISSEAAGVTILGVGITNGIPEAFISAIIVTPVVLGIRKVFKNK